MIGLVEFSCGCIGWPPIERDGKQVALILLDCSSEDGEYCMAFHSRSVDDKSWKALSAYEVMTHIDKIRQLVFDGYKLRDLQKILLPENPQSA
jgi:hypothetical protein